MSVTATQRDDAVERVLQRTVELAQIPAPSFGEQERAEVVQRWWRDDGAREVRIDAAGNVWALAAGDSDGRRLVVAAHLDTVFPASADHAVRREGGRLYGRSVGDNSVAVAGITELINTPGVPTGAGLWLLATTGEEGLGNLHGARHALADGAVEAFIAVEGNMLGLVGVEGVASLRLEVVLEAPGGHAWVESDAPSAVHEGAALITRALEELPIEHGSTSFNVGTFRGGGSINSRAGHAELQLDIRATSQEALDRLERMVQQIVGDVSSRGVTATINEIGRRPGGSIATDHPLVVAAETALREADVASYRSGISTDANAAYALDIPAITLGITVGELHHTPDEWIDVGPVGAGLMALARTVELYWSEALGVSGL